MPSRRRSRAPVGATGAGGEPVELRFLVDEDFDNDVLRGLRRRCPELDVVRVQDIGLAGEDDPVILEWAAQQERIFVTHDAKPMPGHAYARVRAGLRMCGVSVVTQSAPIGRRIEDLLLTVRCLRQDEWENRVRHVPL